MTALLKIDCQSIGRFLEVRLAWDALEAIG